MERNGFIRDPKRGWERQAVRECGLHSPRGWKWWRAIFMSYAFSSHPRELLTSWNAWVYHETKDGGGVWEHAGVELHWNIAQGGGGAQAKRRMRHEVRTLVGRGCTYLKSREEGLGRGEQIQESRKAWADIWFIIEVRGLTNMILQNSIYFILFLKKQCMKVFS